MRTRAPVALSFALTALAIAPSLRAIDWTAFDDPKAVILADPIVEEVRKSGESERAASTQRLRDALESKEVEVRRRAALTLHGLGDAAGVPVMIADLSTAAGRDRDNVVVALRLMKDPRAVPALRAALKDESAYVRSIAVAALGETKAVEAYDEIVALTRDKGEPPKGKAGGVLDCMPIRPADLACYALGALGERRAAPVLIDLLADKDLESSAAQALEALTGERFGADAAKWSAWWREQK